MDLARRLLAGGGLKGCAVKTANDEIIGADLRPRRHQRVNDQPVLACKTSADMAVVVENARIMHEPYAGCQFGSHWQLRGRERAVWHGVHDLASATAVRGGEQQRLDDQWHDIRRPDHGADIDIIEILQLQAVDGDDAACNL